MEGGRGIDWERSKGARRWQITTTESHMNDTSKTCYVQSTKDIELILVTRYRVLNELIMPPKWRLTALKRPPPEEIRVQETTKKAKISVFLKPYHIYFGTLANIILLEYTTNNKHRTSGGVVIINVGGGEQGEALEQKRTFTVHNIFSLNILSSFVQHLNQTSGRRD